jgi:hypothetical protein
MRAHEIATSINQLSRPHPWFFLGFTVFSGSAFFLVSHRQRNCAGFEFGFGFVFGEKKSPAYADAAAISRLAA